MKPLKKMLELSRTYRVEKGKDFKLKEMDPGDTGGLKSELKSEAQEFLQQGVAELAELQAKLYAQDRWAVLLIFQAMDAAGKDSAIKHVMSGVNPQGVQVFSFKQPSAEELDHDFLWRSARRLPERGRIGVFNRSYYEEVLVVRVHEGVLRAEKLPDELITPDIWKERCRDIAAFERYLTRQGTLILKFFLHLSKAEQKKRFLARLDEPGKNWKFSASDVAERQYWDEYQASYEDAIRSTAAPQAPWFVVPADHKWFTRLAVMAAITEGLRGLDLAYPKVEAEDMAALEQARRMLEGE